MLVWLMIIVGVIFLDQLTKWLTVINLELGETFPVIEGVLHFTYRRNTGAAFSLFDEPDQRWIFMTISTVAIIAMLVYLVMNRNKSKLLCVALSFVVGGGIGNMIDRCILKYVVDFIDVRLINFAVFNVADSFVCVGVGLLALYIILDEVKNAKLERAKAAEENSAEKAPEAADTPSEPQENCEEASENAEDRTDIES